VVCQRFRRVFSNRTLIHKVNGFRFRLGDGDIIGYGQIGYPQKAETAHLLTPIPATELTEKLLVNVFLAIDGAKRLGGPKG
jgi:hypothetical protein